MHTIPIYIILYFSVHQTVALHHYGTQFLVGPLSVQLEYYTCYNFHQVLYGTMVQPGEQATNKTLEPRLYTEI